MEKENKKLKITANKKVVVFSLIALALLIISSTSYAYFTAVIEGNDTAKQTSVTTGTMSLKLDGTIDVNMDSAMPETTVEMPFNVTNTGSIDTIYAIALTGIQNTFADKSDLVYTIEDKAGNIIKNQTIYPVASSVDDVITLVPAIAIGSGEKQEYIMKITFLEKNEPQNDNQGKIFTGKIQLADNTKLLVANILTSQPISEIEDYTYHVSEWAYDKEVEMDTSKNNNSMGVGICVTESIENIKGSDMTNYICNVTNPNDYIGWYTFGFNDYMGGYDIYKIKEVQGSIITKADKADIYGLYGEGLIKENDNDGASYVFRGSINNNYVSFADNTWRIIRINGDGSIRISLDKAIDNIQYNASNDHKYVGYTYDNDHICTVSNPCTSASGTSSNIKAYLDNWYSNNLQAYDSYIIESGFCNDTSYTEKDGNRSYSKANIYNDNNTISLECNNPSDNYGGYYKLKIGTLSADEVLMAGYGYNTPAPESNYLYKGNSIFWTMSPLYSSNSSEASIYAADSDGRYWEPHVDDPVPVLPVINLKADTIIMSGNGTKDNPYVIN